MNGPAGPAFLIGVPRSGTTLLSFLLGRHPEVAAPAEPWIMLAVESFGRVSARHPAESNLIGDGLAAFRGDIDLDAALAGFAADLYRRRLAAAGRRVMVDKTPRYWHVLPFLRRLFPESPVLLILRDPFDVLASYKSSWGLDVTRPDPLGRDVFMRLDLTLGFSRVAAHRAADDPGTMVVRYEDLVRDTAPTLAHVQRFLGLEPLVNAARVDFAEIATAFGDSPLGDRKILSSAGVHAGSVGRWRDVLTPEELQAGLNLWGTALVEDLGYGASLAEVLARGVTAPEPAAVAARVAGAEAELARRWDDTARVARSTPGLDELRAAIDIAHADPRQVLHAAAVADGLRHQIAEAHAEAETEISRHRSALDEAGRQIEFHRSALDEAGRQIESHRAALDRARDDMERHRAQVADAERQILEHRAMLERAGADLARLGEEVRHLSSETGRLSAELRDSRSEAERWRGFGQCLWRSRIVGGYLRMRGMTLPGE
ncbi:MAG: sulfotransferase [Caulobacter sp.]|nr:sulfotransferase [Caulobacter sp.]